MAMEARRGALEGEVLGGEGAGGVRLRPRSGDGASLPPVPCDPHHAQPHSPGFAPKPEVAVHPPPSVPGHSFITSRKMEGCTGEPAQQGSAPYFTAGVVWE